MSDKLKPKEDAVFNKIVDSIKTDVRNSLKDSEGNTLTDEQAEFFKDSKVTDKDGKLLPMYHATNADFTVFDRNKIGSSGAGHYLGYGFNFASSDSTARQYGKNVMSVYLNVENPLLDTEKTLTAGHIARLIERIDNANADFKDDISQSGAWEMYEYGYNISSKDSPALKQQKYKRAVKSAANAIYEYADSDADIYAQLSQISTVEAILNTFSSIGRDGVLWHNDDGNIRYAITFDSNQAKNMGNVKPTADPDVRYSKKDSEYGDFLNDAKTGVVYNPSSKYYEIVIGGKPETDIDFDTKEEAEQFYSRYEHMMTADEDSAYYDYYVEELAYAKNRYESSKAKKTSINALLENLDKYRRNDLISLGEQLSGGNWDNIEDYSTKDIRNNVEEMLNDVKSELNTLEAQAPKYGYFVRPVADNEDVRNSLKDERYLSLAQNPEANEAELQKMVGEEAKRAGYTVKAYHGSNGFGFTKFDAGKSDDDVSLFFTDSKSVAGSYTGNPKVKPIGKRVDTPETIRRADEIIAQYNDGVWDFDGEISKTNKGEYKIQDYSAGLHGVTVLCKTASEFIDTVTPLMNDGEMGGIYDTYLKMDNPLTVDVNGEWYAIRFVPPGAEEYYNRVDEAEDNYDEVDFFNAEEMSKAEESISIAKEELYDFLRSSGVELNENNEVTTRSVSKYAKAKGYDGVIFERINDVGFYGADEDISTVYVVFDSNQVKSADPVTYDDDGNIIPLSERFKDSNDDIRWSKKDSEGRTLSEQQVEFFKDSKARDKDGNLLRVYHTTTSDFTIFDKAKKGSKTGEVNTYLGFFFTDQIDWLKEFKAFRDTKTDAYYINLTNPIDLTDISREAFLDIVEVMGENIEQAARLYDDELEQEKRRCEFRYRIEPKGGLSKPKLLFDNLWNELTGDYFYYEFYPALEPHYNDLMSRGYDGVIDYMDEMAGAKEFIILDSNQAKLATNKKPTADPDIRFSKKGSADILKENAQLKAINDALRRELTITEFRGVDEKKLGKYAGSVLKEYSSKYDKAELTKQLKSVYDYIQGAEGDANFDEAMDRLTDISRNILGKSEVINNDTYNEYVELRKDLRTTGVTLADRYKADIPGYADFRKRNFGKVKIVNDGVPVDVKYMELSDLYPEFFPDDIYHPADMLVRMTEVAEDLKPFAYNPYDDGLDYTTRVLASELFEGFFEAPQQSKTFADKQQEKLFKERTKRVLVEDKLKSAKEMIADLKGTLRWKDAETNYLLDSMKGKQREQIAKLKKKYEEKAQQKEDNLNRREKVERIKKYYNDLRKAYKNPSETKHIPEDLKPMVAKFLAAFDFTTPRQSVDTILRFNDMKQYFEVEALKGGAEDINPVAAEMVDLLDNFILTMPKKPISNQGKGTVAGEDYMSNADVETLYKITKLVKQIIRNYDQILAGNIRAKRSEMGERMIDQHSGASTQEIILAKEKVKNFFNFDLANAYTFAEQMGSAYKELFNNLDRGYDKLINNIDTAKSYMDKARKDAGIDDTVIETMTGENAEIKTYKVSSGQTLQLTKSQVMFLYLSSKREQAMNHILGGGITPKPIITKRTRGADGKFKFTTKLKQTEPVKMKVEDVDAIISTLTTKEKAFADAISKFLNTTTSDWGNEVSMAMYGYKRFTEKNYIGIMSDKNYLDANFGTTYEPSLTGKGWTKQVNEKATNPIVIDDLFSYYAGFTNEIAIYNALALPTADIKAVMNYKSKDPVSPNFGKSVKQAVDNNLGEGAMRFFKQLMIDINGGMQKEVATNLGRKLLGMNKAAVIGLSLSSTVQQPTAVFRASAFIDSKYLAKGFAMKGDFDKVIKYSNIAKWKSFGYFGNDMGQSVTDLIIGKKRKDEKFFLPMELADNFTWSKLWNACELEIQDTMPGLSKGSDEFYSAVASRFDYIVKNSQVVDTVLKRTQIMRSNSDFNRLYTSFMGEPLENVNMLMRAGNAYMKDKSSHNKAFLARTVSGILLSQTAAAFAKALAQTLTGKQDDKEYLEKVWGNLTDDLTGMIPYVDDIAEVLLTGEAPSNLVWQGLINLNKAITSIADLFNPESTKTPMQNIKTAVSASGMAFGVPTNNVISQVEGFLKTMGKAVGGAKGSYQAMKIATNIKNSDNRTKFMDALFEAWQDGDKEAISYIKTDMMKNGITNDYIQTAFKNKQKKWLKDQKDIQKVAKLVKAYNSKDESKRDLNERAKIVDQMNQLASKYAEQGYPEDIVISAIKEQAKK